MSDAIDEARPPPPDAATEEPKQRRRNFYADAFDEQALFEAAQVEGIDDELASLRLLLLKEAKKKPQTLNRLLRGIEVVVRAAAIKYRMSPANKEDLAEAVMTVARKLREDLVPGEFDDV